MDCPSENSDEIGCRKFETFAAIVYCCMTVVTFTCMYYCMMYSL